MMSTLPAATNATSELFKTDVIFLGAGASVSAKYPMNAGLARYITDELLNRGSKSVGKAWTGVPHQFSAEWELTARKLRETKFRSVDKFCELSDRYDRQAVLDLKRMVQVALFDHSVSWHLDNDYCTFIDKLFNDPETWTLNDKFTVVNFNYEGLLSHLLVEAVVARHAQAGKQPPTKERMASIAGGYYAPISQHSYNQANKIQALDPRLFCHHMPHGNAVFQLRPANDIYSLQAVFFSSEDFVDRNDALLHYDTFRYSQPVIHFPWEQSKPDIFGIQVDHIKKSVEEAPRLHFIGLSGDPLLKHSLLPMFDSIHNEQVKLFEKHLHIAALNPEETLLRLLDCFLTGVNSRTGTTVTKAHFLNRMTKEGRIHYYKSFAEWLDASPHTFPLGYDRLLELQYASQKPVKQLAAA